MTAQGYLFYLVDKSGLILLHDGIWTQSESLALQNSRTGILANEESEGTTAHSLCFRLKRPVLLMGPEHYCTAFQSRVASAAPIRTNDDDVAASLVIFSPPLLDVCKIEDQNLKTLYLSSVGMVAALAIAAETQIKQVQNTVWAQQQIEHLQYNLITAQNESARAHIMLSASMGFSDEGMVVVDSLGKILQINQTATKILQVGPDELEGINICDFLRDGPRLMKMSQDKGDGWVSEELVKPRYGRARQHRIHALPVMNKCTGTLDYMMLKFAAQDKVADPARNARCSAGYTFTCILGESQSIKTVIGQAKRYANSAESVLILGESGTGKELFAQSLHNAYRPKGPFMAVNCAALPNELIGTELFGYEGGSFTGAERQGRAGKIELAHGGTLFLDEIGDMSLEHQAVLLRTLEDKKVMRVGGSSYREVDFRLIAATNVDLAQKVRDHTFREDLFYRISVLTLSLPPLRERAGDIPLLSKIFLENYCCKQGCSTPSLSAEVLKLLEEYSWPGNVRQLQNAIHHTVNTTEGDTILPEDLPRYIITEIGLTAAHPKPVLCGGTPNGTLSLKEIEKATIEAALRLRSNSIDAAAESVGLSRSTFYRKIKEYNIIREPGVAQSSRADAAHMSK
ncbi:MAG: sigma 54-interacting transcriptional regulator [Acidobacteriota bacterium]|nr:sigma 54-interacting transcriptional regulator [Acidobacteriota bacterium]